MRTGRSNAIPSFGSVSFLPHGDHFTGGLDLADVGPRIGADGLDSVPDGGINPWQVSGEQLTKPVVMAVQGTCLTLGIELMLASDVVIAADSTVFGQIEVGPRNPAIRRRHHPVPAGGRLGQCDEVGAHRRLVPRGRSSPHRAGAGGRAAR